MSNKSRILAGLFLSIPTIVIAAWFLITVFRDTFPSFLNELVPALSGTVTLIGILYVSYKVLSRASAISRRHSTELRIADLSTAHGLEPAESILKNCRATGTPYAVYLRSFSFEKQPGSLLTQIIQVFGSREPQPDRKVEKLILEHIGGVMPVLALSDPSAPFHMSGVPRFRRPGTHWVDFLEDLLKDSALIIIYLADDSPGLMVEIDSIRKMGLFDKAVVILRNNKKFNGNTESLSEFKSLVFERGLFFHNRLAEQLNIHLGKTRNSLLH